MIPWNEVMSGVGMAGGVWAIVRWNAERHRHGNGPGSPTEPPPTPTQQAVEVQQAQAERALVAHFTGSLEESAKSMVLLSSRVQDLITREQAQPPKEPAPDPAWVAALETRFAAHTAALERSEARGWTPEASQSIERVVDRLEAILQMGPQEPPPLPPEIAELPDKLEELSKKQDASERKVLSAVRSSGGAPPPRARRDPPPSRAIPDPLPPIPSIPPAYVGGTVTIPGGAPQNLLLLIQQQLQPNCPGACVQLRLMADTEVFVGAASFYGGPLSASNYAYVLEAGEEKLYRSAYPGSSCPLGDLQVLGSGALNVEVQL